MRKHAHITHHGHRKMMLSRWEHLFIHVALPTLIVVCAAYAIGEYAQRSYPQISFNEFAVAIIASILRISVAFAISLVLGVALAILTLSSRLVERITLPIWDVLESFPILAFFPAILAIFIGSKGYSLAAICVMALAMIGNILFSSVGGLRVIPEEVRSVGTVFGLTYLQKLKHIILPALVPSVVTGSLLAWAEGWNMLIVVEVIHTYIPNTTIANDLYGIGSILVHASASGNTRAFVAAVAIMVAVIVLMNIALWQPLLRYSERFKFE